MYNSFCCEGTLLAGLMTACSRSKSEEEAHRILDNHTIGCLQPLMQYYWGAMHLYFAAHICIQMLLVSFPRTASCSTSIITTTVAITIRITTVAILRIEGMSRAFMIESARILLENPALQFVHCLFTHRLGNCTFSLTSPPPPAAPDP